MSQIYKIYREGNYIRVVDVLTNELFNGAVKDVFIDKSNVQKNEYTISKIKDFDETNTLSIGKILKSDDTAYSISEWETFYTENTGNFNGGGAAPETLENKVNIYTVDGTGEKYYTADYINETTTQIEQDIQAQLVDSTIINGVTTSSSVPPTGNIHAIGVGAGTYPNWGGMVIPSNNIGTLSRVSGTYSVSLTAFSDVNKILPWVSQSYPINSQVNHLGIDWVSNAATISTDIPGVSSKWVERLEYLKKANINKDEFNGLDNENPASQKSIATKINPIFNGVKVLQQPDGVYLTDNNGYVIAKVTASGIQSVSFLNKNGEDVAGVSNVIKAIETPEGFLFVDYLGYVVAKVTAAGIQAVNYLDKDGNSLSTKIHTLIKGKQFYTLGDSLCEANLLQPKLAELTGSTFNASLNLSVPLSVGGTRTGGVNTTCGQWRAKLLFELGVNPEVIFIENINDLNNIASLGTIADEPFMLQNIITYPSTFASLAALNTWLGDGSFATYLATFATIDKKIGSGIRFPYTDSTTKYREYIFDSKVVANWTTTSLWKYEGSGNTIYKVYKGLLEFLKVKFPTALIMWFAPTRISIQTVSGQAGYNAAFWNSDGSFNMTAYKASTDVVNYQTLVDAQKAVCKYYSVPFINVNEECGINPLNFLTYYPQNNVHPLTVGYEKWGETIAKLI